jgi:hypothetical protein
MPLDDYTFQLRDTGTVLNAEVALPFVDIDRVIGLDSAPFRETIRDHEGVDGGFIDAEFEQGREIAIDGMAYADINTIEAFMDTLKGEYGPITTPVPFYFKAPGADERVIFVKPRGVAYDWDAARRKGMTPVQFRMFAEDPRLYDNNLLTVTIPYGGEATTGLGFTNFTDTFTRVFSPLWSTLDTGQTWFKVDSGDLDSNYAVNGTQGTIMHSSTNTVRGMLIDSGFANQNLQVDALLTVTPTGAAIGMGAIMHFNGTTDYYWADVQVNTDDTITIRLLKNVAGVITTITSAATGQVRSSTIAQRLECMITPESTGTGTTNRIRVKTWQVGTAYPAAWQIDTTDSSHMGGDWCGPVTRATTGNTNVTPVIAFDNFRLIRGLSFNLNFGVSVPPSGAFVTVGGNRPTPAILTIEGPITNPRIINETDGKTLAFDIVLGALDTLVIDLAYRTVVFNGNANRRDALQAPDWFLFNPGSTFIKFGGGGGSGILSIEYRNAWR